MTKSKRVLFDSNVLIYAQDADCAWYEHSIEIHRQAIDGEIQAALSIQNIIEFLSIITNPKRVPVPLTRDRALSEVRKYVKSGIFSIITPNATTPDELTHLVSYWDEKSSQHIFDLHLVATMKSNGISKIVTANTADFDTLPGLEVIDLQSIVK